MPGQLTLKQYLRAALHENLVGFSSTTNPKPKVQPSIPMPAQASVKGRAT